MCVSTRKSVYFLPQNVIFGRAKRAERASLSDTSNIIHFNFGLLLTPRWDVGLFQPSFGEFQGLPF
jgi:hypothetical protein